MSDEPKTAHEFANALVSFIEAVNVMRDVEGLGPVSVRSMNYRRYIAIDEPGGSVFCFVAACNGEPVDKTGAYVRSGDILKAASWKKPAPHARGNIFDVDPMKRIGKYGPEYLT